MSTPFEAKKLLKVLSDVKPGLQKKEGVDVETALNLAHFVFTGDRVITTDKAILISAPFETDFACSVLADPFFAAISAIGPMPADMRLENEHLIIEADNVNAKIPIKGDYDLDKLMEILELTDVKWYPLPEDFVEGVRLCQFSTSPNATSNFFCVRCEMDVALSCDNKRASKFTFSDQAAFVDDPMLLPRTATKELVNYPVTEYSVPVDGRVHFRTEDDAIFSTSMMTGKFLDISEFFNIEGQTVELPSAPLLEALKCAMPLVKQERSVRSVTISISGTTLFVNASGARGSLNQRVLLEQNTPDIKFMINPIFLGDILEKSTTATVGRDRILFSREDGKFIHIVARSVEDQ